MSTLLSLCQDAHRILGLGSRGNVAKPGTVPTTTVGQTDELAEIVDWVIKEWQKFQAEKKWGWMVKAGTLVFATSTSTVRPLATLTTMAEWAPFVEGIGRYARRYALCYLTSAGSTAEQPIYFEEYDVFRGWRDRGTVATGRPTHFTIEPNLDWHVYPTPDASYTLRFDYRVKPILLTAASDNSTLLEDYPATGKGLPSHHQQVIVWRAVKQWAATRKDQAMYEIASREIKALMIPICREYLPPPRFL